jgi:hypothetical protein
VFKDEQRGVCVLHSVIDVCVVTSLMVTHGLSKVPEGVLEFETRTNKRGHGYKLKKMCCNTSMRQHLFSLRVTHMWNSLPDGIVDALSINAFMNRLDEAMQERMFSLEIPSALRIWQ